MAPRLRNAAPVVAVCVLVAITWDFASSRLDPGVEAAEPFLATFIGVLISLPLIFESSAFGKRLRRLPFLAAVLYKTVAYVGALSLIFLGMGLIVGWSQGLTMVDFAENLPSSFAAISTAFVMYLAIIFVRQLNSLLGPGVLVRYLTGRYHHPRRERRIFMFVDIEGSTALSERLSLEAYYGLVNDFFRDVATPVLDSQGEIYEYVGDEVVISWKHEVGVRNANCVRAFFEIEKAVWSNSARYLKRYGAVPQFKAGLHEGEVIAAEMGSLKKIIAFNGEVLNVTARIQGECNRLERRLLASQQLVEQLRLPADVTPHPVGPVELRGTDEPMELVALA